MIEADNSEEQEVAKPPKKDGMWFHYAIILLNVIVLIFLSQELSFRDSYEHHQTREAIRNLKVTSLSLEKDIIALPHHLSDDYSDIKYNKDQFLKQLEILKKEKKHGHHHSADLDKILRTSSELVEKIIAFTRTIEETHKRLIISDNKVESQFELVEAKLINDHGLHWLYMTVRNLKLHYQYYIGHQSDASRKKFESQLSQIRAEMLGNKAIETSQIPDLHLMIKNLLDVTEQRTRATHDLNQSLALYRALPQMQTYDQLYYMFENEFTKEEEQINTIIILFYVLLLGSWLHIGYLIIEMRKRNKIIQKKSDDYQRDFENQKELNELQRKFVSMVSHEFRTPLAIIDSGAQKLLRRAEKMQPNKVKEVAMKTRAHINKLIELLDSTLHSQRMDAGQMELMAGQCDLKLIISDVCQLQYEIHTRNSIQLQVSDLPQEITADEKLISHVFTNLISNAVKYSPDGTEVIVTGYDRGDMVEVEVRDSGVGIPENEISELFGCFYRASTSIGISGTGIGLHLVKNIVDKHHGEIEVESTVGEGSIFRVRLPKQQPDEQVTDEVSEIVEKVA